MRSPCLAVSVLILLLIVPLAAQGQCINYADYLRGVGSLDTPDWTLGVVVSGTVAYVADGSSDLQVIDVSNPGVMAPAITR